jgi:hypothetical protein
MRIGIDFDNTIVSYDALFHRVARELDLVPAATPPNKVAVRDHLRCAGREDDWTEMQGTVYGSRVDEALAFPGVVEFLRRLKARGDVPAVISHKTRHPFIGPRHDLHQSARGWIDGHLGAGNDALVAPERVFFELTKQDKIGRIAAFGCEVFIDDLPEILLDPQFPPSTRRILFDPERHHAPGDYPQLEVAPSWADICRVLEL